MTPEELEQEREYARRSNEYLRREKDLSACFFSLLEEWSQLNDYRPVYRSKNCRKSSNGRFRLTLWSPVVDYQSGGCPEFSDTVLTNSDLAIALICIQQAISWHSIRISLDYFPDEDTWYATLIHPDDVAGDPDRGWNGSHQYPAIALLKAYLTFLKEG